MRIERVEKPKGDRAMANVKNCNGGGTLSSTPVSSGLWTGCACNRAEKPSGVQDLYPRPFVGEGVRRTGEGSHPDKIAQQVRNDSVCSLAPRWESGFAYGRSEASPDSEQIEHVIAEQFMRNSVSVEQIQDGLGRGGKTSNRKVAFTLAEVLITLGIIGVVAALTMPALITNIQDRIQAKRIENINQKLSKVTDKMAVQSGLTGYGTTMAFVQEMSKHMKIAKICDNEHLAECWPTQEVTLNDEGKTWEIAKTKNAKNLKISNKPEDWADTVGIVTGDGTGMILSYNKKCEFNVDDVGLKYDSSTGKSNSLVCLSGVYDWNGSSKPNKLGKDVTMLAPASGLGTACAIEAGGKCFTAAFTPTPLTRAQCAAEKDKLGIKECCSDGFCNGNDYWAGAVKQCGGVSKMPTQADLTELAKVLYNTSNINSSGWTYNLTLDTSKASSMGFTGSSFVVVWSGEVYDSNHAYYRSFLSSQTGRSTVDGRSHSNYQAVCLGD